MGRIEDLKETAPCGMEIHYTVDENDMIAYNDINGRGRSRRGVLRRRTQRKAEGSTQIHFMRRFFDRSRLGAAT